MKTIIKIALIGCILLLTSCIERVDGGFPEEVTFPREGGELTLNGDGDFAIPGITIKTDDADQFPSTENEDGSMSITHQWLTATSPAKWSSQLTLTAQPNTSGKKRKLDVWLEGGPTYVMIKVIQDK